jgi:hypothetical protein
MDLLDSNGSQSHRIEASAGSSSTTLLSQRFSIIMFEYLEKTHPSDRSFFVHLTQAASKIVQEQARSLERVEWAASHGKYQWNRASQESGEDNSREAKGGAISVSMGRLNRCKGINGRLIASRRTAMVPNGRICSPER